MPRGSEYDSEETSKGFDYNSAISTGGVGTGGGYPGIKRNPLCFKNIFNEMVILSRQEINREVHEILTNDLEFFTFSEINKRKESMLAEIISKLDSFEDGIHKMLNAKFDLISQQVVEKIITSMFEKEVDRKVEEKLKKIRGKF